MGDDIFLIWLWGPLPYFILLKSFSFTFLGLVEICGGDGGGKVVGWCKTTLVFIIRPLVELNKIRRPEKTMISEGIRVQFVCYIHSKLSAISALLSF